VCFSPVLESNRDPLPLQRQGADPSGISKLLLKAGSAGRIVVRGKGALLALPVGPLAEPVTVQLVRADGPGCWEAAFPAAVKNDGVSFRARTD
jgi:hypothetical protein